MDSAEHQSPGQTPASKNFYFAFSLRTTHGNLSLGCWPHRISFFPLTVKSCRLSGWSPVSLPPFKSSLPTPLKIPAIQQCVLQTPTDLGLLVHHPHYFIDFLSPLACSRQRSRSYGGELKEDFDCYMMSALKYKMILDKDSKVESLSRRHPAICRWALKCHSFR